MAGGKSGKTPGRNLPTRTVLNLRNSLVVINQSISNLLRVHFFHTAIKRATKYNLKNQCVLKANGCLMKRLKHAEVNFFPAVREYEFGYRRLLENGVGRLPHSPAGVYRRRLPVYRLPHRQHSIPSRSVDNTF